MVILLLFQSETWIKVIYHLFFMLGFSAWKIENQKTHVYLMLLLLKHHIRLAFGTKKLPRGRLRSVGSHHFLLEACLLYNLWRGLHQVLFNSHLFLLSHLLLLLLLHLLLQMLKFQLLLKLLELLLLLVRMLLLSNLRWRTVAVTGLLFLLEFLEPFKH